MVSVFSLSLHNVLLFVPQDAEAAVPVRPQSWAWCWCLFFGIVLMVSGAVVGGAYLYRYYILEVSRPQLAEVNGPTRGGSRRVGLVQVLLIWSPQYNIICMMSDRNCDIIRRRTESRGSVCSGEQQLVLVLVPSLVLMSPKSGRVTGAVSQ